MLDKCNANIDSILLLHLGAETDAAQHEIQNWKVLIFCSISDGNQRTEIQSVFILMALHQKTTAHQYAMYQM